MKDEQDTAEKPAPLVALRNMVMFPGVITSLRIGRPRSVAAMHAAQRGGGRLLMVAQRELAVESPGAEDLYSVGVMCKVLQVVGPDEAGVWRALVEGRTRCRILGLAGADPYLSARVRQIEDIEMEVPADLVDRVKALVGMSAIGSFILKQLRSADVFELDFAIAFSLELSVADKQMLLAEPSRLERYRMLVPVLEREKQIRLAGERLQEQSRYGATDEERRHYLEGRREGLERELSELVGSKTGPGEMRERVMESELPPEAHEEAIRELARLERIPPESPEYGLIVDYLELLCDLPWNRSTDAEVSIEEARSILERDHYGRQEVKERILEYLSVRRLRQERGQLKGQGALLCLVGAPGVGKTSLGRSIAAATGRKFYRISLGGVRDEAEIRGHRRTYVGALPGRIIRALRAVAVNDPVLLLDELDTLHSGLRGDPGGALLEVMDPEQNETFVDNYLQAPFDLSRIMFIGAANTTDTIPSGLLDRLEVIELSGYSTDQKIAIARRHLIPKQLDEAGLAPDALRMDEEAIESLIEGYTSEAGVRGLERQIAAICRKLALERLGSGEAAPIVGRDDIERLLGPPKRMPERDRRSGRPGVCATLVVSPQGGRLMLVEITRVDGAGKLIVTGRLGQALRESAQIAYSYWKANAPAFGLAADVMERSDFHVHLPAAAVAKEAAFVGLPIAVAFASVLLERPLAPGAAVIGEVTLTGNAAPVLRLEERLVAARRANIKRLALPERNRPSVEGLRRQGVAGDLEIVYVRSVPQAVEAVLGQAPDARAVATALPKEKSE